MRLLDHFGARLPRSSEMLAVSCAPDSENKLAPFVHGIPAMVQVTLRISVQPERVAATIQTLRVLMLPLQAFPGFLACDLFLDTQDQNELCYIEEWKDSQALHEQIRSKHFERLLQVMENSALPPTLRLSWITEVRGLDYLEEVRARIDDSTGRSPAEGA